MKRLASSALLATLCMGFVLPGCVSSRKYKESQQSLELSRQHVEALRSDSTRCATETTALNEKVTTLEQERTTMRTSLDSLNNYIAAQKPNMDYQAYLNNQENVSTQMRTQLSSDLSNAGLTDQEIMQKNGAVYVNIDEVRYFAVGSAALNTKGKKVVNQLASSIKGQPDMVVNVRPAAASTNDMANTSTDNNTSTGIAADNSAGADNSTGVKSKATTTKRSSSTGYRSTAATKKKSTTVKRASSESGRTYVSNRAKKYNRPMSSAALKTARANSVAKSLLQNGVEQVTVTMKNGKTKGSVEASAIQVVISPDNTKMMEQKTETTAGNTSGKE